MPGIQGSAPVTNLRRVGIRIVQDIATSFTKAPLIGIKKAKKIEFNVLKFYFIFTFQFLS